MVGQPVFASKFEFTPDNQAVVITMAGKLDAEAVEELHPQVQEVYRAGVRRFVLDLSKLDYAGSMGLRLMVSLSNQVKGHGAIAACGAARGVWRVLEMTKVNKVVPQYPSRVEALAAITSRQ